LNPLNPSALPTLIAIDGPAASGKSTIGLALAQRLGYLFFDTGIMYRAVTWAAAQRRLAPDDAAATGALASALDIDILPAAGAADGRTATVLVEGIDVTWELRAPAVEQAVSAVSAHAAVRAALTAQQRQIALRYQAGSAERPGIVMVGRDIGTAVLPEAPLKIYLDASPAERARRRHAELAARGRDLPLEQILAEILQRDTLDAGRAVAPLRPADDAIHIDTTGLKPDDVVAQIMALRKPSSI
jgi:cytidylate kinase